VFDVAVKGGDDDGRRIEVTDPKVPGVKLPWYVIGGPGGYRIVAPGPGAANLGAEALRQLDLDHLQTAVRWLDWAMLDKPHPSILDSFATSPFAYLWVSADRSRPESVRLAAAALVTEGSDPAPAVAILLFAQTKTEKSSEKLQIDRALAQAYSRLHRWPELLKTLERFRDGYDRQLSIVALEIAAFNGLNRKEELRRLIQAQLTSSARKLAEQEVLAGLSCDLGAIGPGQDFLRSRAIQGKISALSLNQLAWNAAFQDPPAMDAINDALYADRRSDRVVLLYPKVRALLYAEQGNANEARESLLRGEDDFGAPPGDVEWYVLGRIAEHFGLSDIATTLYGKVSAPKLPDDRAVYVLAQRRLNRHGQPEEQASPDADMPVPTPPVAPSGPPSKPIPPLRFNLRRP